MKLSRLSDPLFVTGLVLALPLMILDRFDLLPFGAGVDGGAPAGLLLAWGISHCDTLDGPVVNLARKALETGNVNQALPWVRASDEAEIKTAFSHAIAVRKLGPQARELADRHFFETVVRIHRAGEGAPFTGLKAAGQDLGPAVPAADQALENGSVEKVVTLLTDELNKGIHRHFHAAVERKNFAVDDVKAGRRFVEAYVPYIHYVERLWQTISSEAHGHHPEAAARQHHSH
ncbi:MAG: DUF6448 family protein [Burkholderiales bacterium]|nr:DUF6448 family protein [Burkholderiales bacterium]